MSTFDRDKIRRRIQRNLLTHPLTVVPVVLGVGSASLPFIAGTKLAFGLFGGVVGLVVGGAVLGLRALLGREGITASVLEQLEHEAAEARRLELKDLWDRLAEDADPRDELLLSDLNKLTSSVREDSSWRNHVDTTVAADVLGGLDELFQQCVHDLERSLSLRDTASDLSDEATRSGLLQERENVLAEVRTCIEAIGSLLGQLKVLGTRAGAGTDDLERLRKNLLDNLATAREAATETRLGTDDIDRRLAAARRRAAQQKQEL